MLVVIYQVKKQPGAKVKLSTSNPSALFQHCAIALCSIWIMTLAPGPGIFF